jgi:hypothetical protein
MFLVSRPRGSWELRESHLTTSGPRSRTLATFRELTAQTIAHVADRAPGPLDVGALRALCRRAGASVAPAPADGAAAELLSGLARGERPRGPLLRVLAAELGSRNAQASDSELAAARWVAADAAERGRALRDLLLLADRLPAPAHAALAFPSLAPSH